MKLLCLDFGDKTVGVAVGDTDLRVASGVETIRRKNAKRLRRTYARIEELVKIYEVKGFVIGLPLTMDGFVGTRAQKTIAFANELKGRTALEIFFQDERMSSLEARELMQETGHKYNKSEHGIDEFAAITILRDYLNGNNTI